MGDSRFDDSRFDALLADALRQVNLEEAAAQSRTEEPDFSPAYRRDRLRLLADPMGWYRRRTGGRKRRLGRAACFAAVCVASVVLLAAVSPDVRASLLLWSRSQDGEYTHFTFHGEGTVTQPASGYTVTALPEGFAETDRQEDDAGGIVVYENGGGCTILLQTGSMDAASSMFLDSEDAEIRSVLVNGCPGELYLRPAPKTNTILWMDEEAKVGFCLQAAADGDTLLAMAESVEKAE